FRSSFLAGGDLITLGADVVLRFVQPHPLSASARLEPVSGHRIEPRADAVILMAESCVLGHKAGNHVVYPDWPADVVLFRSGDTLHCRSQSELLIDDQPAGRSGELSLA